MIHHGANRLQQNKPNSKQNSSYWPLYPLHLILSDIENIFQRTIQIPMPISYQSTECYLVYITTWNDSVRMLSIWLVEINLNDIYPWSAPSHYLKQWRSIVNSNRRNKLQWNLRRNLYNFGNTLRPRQNGRHVPDDIFKSIFLNENIWVLLKISPKFVPKVRIYTIAA